MTQPTNDEIRRQMAPTGYFEVLEMAAKAIGRKGPPPYYDSDGEGGYDEWDPLNDDGDLYRLAKQLGISIQFHAGYCTFVAGGHGGVIRWPEDEPDDVWAIVCAAAEIGKAMP